MKISTAKFIVSNTDVRKCPTDQRPEFAFIGRSNVGKSSLINMLTGNMQLAKTSSLPGKTLLINHFLINDAWYLVDLPGYGYAKRSKKQRLEIENIIKSYILLRDELYNLFLLIDSRLEPQQVDLEFMEFLGENAVPFSIVFTKTDKLSKSRLMININNYKQKLLETWETLPPLFMTSAIKASGKEEVLDYIDEILKQSEETE